MLFLPRYSSVACASISQLISHVGTDDLVVQSANAALTKSVRQRGLCASKLAFPTFTCRIFTLFECAEASITRGIRAIHKRTKAAVARRRIHTIFEMATTLRTVGLLTCMALDPIRRILRDIVRVCEKTRHH